MPPKCIIENLLQRIDFSINVIYWLEQFCCQIIKSLVFNALMFVLFQM